MSQKDDYRYLARAFTLAKRGRYTVSPNPMVGAVLVVNKAIVGEAWHQRAGEPHAEVNALTVAGGHAKGATAYVTLEPCNHTGRTGPCSQALIDAGVSRVVIGATDANPQAAGGAQHLRGAGVQVDFVSGWPDINAGFKRRVSAARPKVVLKLAASLDGRTAMASGQSQWITGTPARYQTQKLRAEAGAVITGVASILGDDSRLNVRVDDWLEPYAPLPVRQPLRVVLDSQLRTPSDAAVLQGSCLIVHTAGSKENAGRLQAAGAQVRPLPAVNAGVDLSELLAVMASEYQCNQVLVEAGAVLSGQFIGQGLVDELHVFSAPMIMGGAARPMFALPISEMANAHALHCREVRHVGSDLWQIYSK